MANYARHLRAEPTQREPLPGQVQNSAGGYSWQVDDWMRMRRFLILGTEGGSYYATERELAKSNAQAVIRCIQQDPERALNLIKEVSLKGKAPKQTPVLFALALMASDPNPEARKLALNALPEIARTGSHLLQFVDMVTVLRGWGRALRKSVANWYLSKSIDELAYQLLKYQSRYNWSHRDVLRLAHPKPQTEEYSKLFRYVIHKELSENLPPLVYDIVALRTASSPEDVISIIRRNKSITWEMIPTMWLAYPEVWKELLPQLPLTALLRNLARMTANKTLVPGNEEVNLVISKITDRDYLRKARIHPLSVLNALYTYSSGKGFRGRLQWNPIPQIVDALDEAFYLAFDNVESTNLRWLLALDISASMSWYSVAGMPALTPRVASAAMAMVTMAKEQDTIVLGFSHNLTPLNISHRCRLDVVLGYLQSLPMGGTDCALPILWAQENNVDVDVIVIYTDNETWYGNIHPARALQQYRQQVGKDVKFIVVGMLANEFSIADPNDPGMLDVVGFDPAAPQIMADFALGLI